MRFTSLIASLVLALTVLVAPSLAITAGITGGLSVGDGNNRASISVGGVSTAIRVAQADTFMIGSARDSVTAHAISYSPFTTSMFNTKIPAQYQGVLSNKDSVQLCLIGYGDADSAVMTVNLQGRYYGTTNATSVYATVATASLTFTSATVQRACATFLHPQTLNFRFLSVGAGTTDTSKVYRGYVIDK